MIKTITCTNYLGAKTVLTLTDPSTSGFSVLGVSGLGPVKATINLQTNSIGDGSEYNSSRRTYRNIVLLLGYTFNPTIEQCRLNSYSAFPTKTPITIDIETDSRTVTTTGRIEYNEPSIFSANSGCSVSVICPDPNFYEYVGDGYVYNYFGTIIPLFEFPFCNDSLDTPLIDVSEIDDSSTAIITYLGDVEVGVIFSIHLLGAVGNIAIYQKIDTVLKMTIDVSVIANIIGNDLSMGDDIVIDTAARTVTVVHSGIEYNALNSTNVDADWFMLSPGSNTFIYTAETGVNNIQFSSKHLLAYEGV